MLTLFKRKVKTIDEQTVESSAIPSHGEHTSTSESQEEELRRRIAAKLQNYHPEEREASFTGPKYFG